MPVSLLSAPSASLGNGRVAGLLCAVSDEIDAPWMSDASRGSGQRSRRDEDSDTSVAAAPVPMRSADVINEAERNVEFSSRAFRRQVAQEGATEQFQSDRQAFRDALSAAREGQSRTTASQDVEPAAPPGSDKNAKTEEGAVSTSGRGAAKPENKTRAKPTPTSAPARPAATQSAETTASRSSKSNGLSQPQRASLPAATLPNLVQGRVGGRLHFARSGKRRDARHM